MKCRRSGYSRGARLRTTTTRAALDRTLPAPESHAAPSNAMKTVVGELRIDRRTDGLIQHAGTVRVGEHGKFFGQIRAEVIAVEGEITGNLYAKEAIRLAATARVLGDLYAPRVAVARGAQLQGRINTLRSAEPQADLDDLALNQVLAGES
jgi:cytoskeletal protein CcmA (bactofilin family)